MPLPQTFKAMVVSETADQKFIREIRQKRIVRLARRRIVDRGQIFFFEL